jgi:hypothetical protein
MGQALRAPHTRAMGITEIVGIVEALLALGVAAGVLMILP